MPQIDPDSPIPLYHQIAEALRERMASGELEKGDALDPMRVAAEQWGVNLHTVRHAYAALARDGLLEMRAAKGTRVTAGAAELASPGRESVTDFVSRVAREADQLHGLSAGQFGQMLGGSIPARRPSVVVIECNTWQCRAHANELEAVWHVDAKPWALSETGEPEGETLVTTYFHYNDIRRRWPHLLGRMKFVTVHIDERVLSLLQSVSKATLIETDEPTAQAVEADLRSALDHPIELEILVSDNPARAIEESKGELVLCPPRVWSSLSEQERALDHCIAVNYLFDESELSRLAQELAWQPSTETTRN